MTLPLPFRGGGRGVGLVTLPVLALTAPTPTHGPLPRFVRGTNQRPILKGRG